MKMTKKDVKNLAYKLSAVDVSHLGDKEARALYNRENCFNIFAYSVGTYGRSATLYQALPSGSFYYCDRCSNMYIFG